MRVGFAVGHPALIEALERVKNSFNSRDTLSAELTNIGFEVLPSAANFIFARHRQRDAGELAKSLRDRNIIVRHFKLPRIDQFLRITVGTDGECKALTDALRQIID